MRKRLIERSLRDWSPKRFFSDLCRYLQLKGFGGSDLQLLELAEATSWRKLDFIIQSQQFEDFLLLLKVTQRLEGRRWRIRDSFGSDLLPDSCLESSLRFTLAHLHFEQSNNMNVMAFK